MLALESPAPISKQGTKWQLSPSSLPAEFWNRIERLTNIRRNEQGQMQNYLELDSGHMEFLVAALDGVTDVETDAPNQAPLPTRVSQGTSLQAVEFLRRSNIVIEPRKRASEGKAIPTGEQALVGGALCYWGDPGWGALVRRGKYEEGYFSDELVAASASLISEWQPEPAPVWVTCIPSVGHSSLVTGFAERLAKRLGLPFREVLAKVADRPPQKDMANSAQQERNAEGALAITPDVEPLTGPVLLVDDMVDSRWTFAVAAKLLRNNGCGDVWPFALANTSTTGD